MWEGNSLHVREWRETHGPRCIYHRITRSLPDRQSRYSFVKSSPPPLFSVVFLSLFISRLSFLSLYFLEFICHLLLCCFACFSWIFFLFTISLFLFIYIYIPIFLFILCHFITFHIHNSHFSLSFSLFILLAHTTKASLYCMRSRTPNGNKNILIHLDPWWTLCSVLSTSCWFARQLYSLHPAPHTRKNKLAEYGFCHTKI